MPVFLAFNLNRASQTGLTLTARCYAGASAAVAVALTESPASSARYTATTSALTSSTAYQVTVENGSNVAFAYGRVVVDAAGNDADLLLDVAVSTRLAPTTAGRTLAVDVAGGVNATQLGSQTVSGTAGTGLTNLGISFSDNSGFLPVNASKWNNVTVTGMPMPTYTQPTGFLAATFPGTVSSYAGGAVASVTAGVTVTTNNDKTGYTLTVTPPTAAAISTQVNSDLTTAHGSGSYLASAVTAASIGGVTVATNNDKTGYSLTQAFPANFSSLVLTNGQTVGTSTYSGTSQTGDAYAYVVTNLGALGANATALAPASTALSSGTWTNAKAAFLNASIAAIPTSTLLAADYTVPPTAIQNAAAVRTNLATELARIDANVSSASAPTAGSVATAVRTELTTELGRIDATVSSRTAAADAIESADLVLAIRNDLERAGGTMANIDLSNTIETIEPKIDQILGIVEDYSPQAIAEALNGANVEIISPISSTGTIELYAGDDLGGDAALRFTFEDLTLDGEPVSLRFLLAKTYNQNNDETVADLVATGTISIEGNLAVAIVPLTYQQTATLAPQRTGDGTSAYRYQLIATDLQRTLADGKAIVRRRIGIA